MTTFRQACDSFLGNIKKSQPDTTYKTYKSTLLGSSGFLRSLAPEAKPATPIDQLTEEMGVTYIQSLLDRGLSPATRQVHSACLREFYRFASFSYGLAVSVDRLNYALKSTHLLAGVKSHRSYPADKIRQMLDFAKDMQPKAKDLAALRDLAFIFSLAETGLRVHEACALKVGQVDVNFRATIIGKGGKKATVFFGKESRSRLNAYLKARTPLDASTGRHREDLPLFCRHDQTSGKEMVKAINPKTGEKIVHNMAYLALGDDYDPAITCHALRHYFGTEYYHKTGNVKATQAALRHSNAETTLSIYVHTNDEEIASTSKLVFG